MDRINNFNRRDWLKLLTAGAAAACATHSAQAQAARYSPATCAYLQSVAGEELPPSQVVGSALEQQTVMLRHSRRFGGDIGALARAVNAGVARSSQVVPGDADVPMAAYDLLQRGTQQALQPGAAPEAGKVFVLPAPVHTDAVVRLALQGRPCAPACYAHYLQEMRARPSSAGDTVQEHARWVSRVLQAFDRFRILCAVHDGPWGDRAMNQQVQSALARAGLLQPEGEWFAGRPVMVTRNDKALGVFNGDIGMALPSFADPARLRVYFMQGEHLHHVSTARLAHVETAFAMTVHKSQGSEFEHTALVLAAQGGNVLSRELVYTAITRAKQRLSIYADEQVLTQSIVARTERRSGLADIFASGV